MALYSASNEIVNWTLGFRESALRGSVKAKAMVECLARRTTLYGGAWA